MLVMGKYAIAVSQSNSWLEFRPGGALEQSPPSTAPCYTSEADALNRT